MSIRAFDVKPIRGPWHIGSNIYSTRYIPGTNRLYERAVIKCLPGGAGHGGRDVHNDTADNIWRAVWDGVIHRYPWDDYGNHIGLVNSDGVEAFYAHGTAIHVSNGQAVKADADLGIIGETGNTSGPHLHFEVRTTPFQWCTAVDPTSLLLAQPQPQEATKVIIVRQSPNTAAYRYDGDSRHHLTDHQVRQAVALGAKQEIVPASGHPQSDIWGLPEK